MDDVIRGDATLAPAVQVLFDLPQEGDWPPVSSELVGALLVTHDTAELQEPPYFARHVAKGDLLRVRRNEDGSWQPIERLKASGNCTIRIVPFRNGPLNGSRERVIDAFAPLGVSGKDHGRFRIVALDIPPTVDLMATKRVLYDGVDAGWWDHEEGCLTDAWLATEPDRGGSGE